VGTVHVAVRENWRWPTARVGGREFSKVGEEMAEGALTEEMRESPLLVLEESPKPKSQSPKAKKGQGEEEAGEQDAGEQEAGDG